MVCHDYEPRNFLYLQLTVALESVEKSLKGLRRNSRTNCHSNQTTNSKVVSEFFYTIVNNNLLLI